VDKRIELVCEIWDSIAAVPEAVGLTNEERALLDERMGALQKDPAGLP
jgi:putative addiction module component (TIGR02574 family)